jgi:sugar phosphate isomerase/epimerase
MIRIGCATFSFGHLTLEESAEVVKSLGFNLVDVGAAWEEYQQISPQEIAKDPTGQADRLRRVMDQHGLGVSELFLVDFGQPISHPDPEERKRTRSMFDRMMVFAQKCGFESVMMIPGYAEIPGYAKVDVAQTPEEILDLSAEALRYMVSVAGEKGIQCNVEPCIGSIAHEPALAVRLIEAVPGLGLTLDYAHQWQLGLGHEDLEQLHKYAKHFHAKQSALGSWQARADEGTIDFKRLIRKLKSENYDGVVCVEFVTEQALLDQGWDVKKETLRLKAILEEALVDTKEGSR